jgi:hypothetical protein
MKNKLTDDDFIKKIFYGLMVESLDELIQDYEDEEEYRICAKLKDINDKLKENLNGTRIQSTTDTGTGESI